MYNAQESFTSRSFTQFFTAFLGCALWATTDDNGSPLERTYAIRDIALESRDRLMLECRDFYETHYDLLHAHGSMSQCGHDFFLTREGHGTGFWDRGTGYIGESLTAAAKVYGSVDLYVGADGTLYAA